jgi:hypothetical protein
MSKFSVEHVKEGGRDVLRLTGHIDEDSDFSGVSYGDGAELVIDFEKVVAINSCGIREWIKWIKEAPDSCQIIYDHCPKVIIDQVNMVSGFLPENGKIQSFYVPYYCEETDSEKMVLFTEGKEFEGGEVNPPDDVVDDETGDEMEMDVIEAKYFKFLK